MTCLCQNDRNALCSRNILITFQIAADKNYLIVLQIPVSLIIAKIICSAVTGRNGTSKIIKTLPLFLQITFWRNCSSLWGQCGEDRIVFFKNPVDRSDHTIGLYVLLVIKGISAPIITKLLISPTLQRLVAHKAFPVIHKFEILTLSTMRYSTCLPPIGYNFVLIYILDLFVTK